MIRALLGGSFDPFHNGHLAMVQTVLDRGLADHVLVVPAHRSPHKAPAVAPARHRLSMARLAVANLAAVTVCDLEVVRGGISYTVDTVAELAAQWPRDALRLIIGADTLDAIHLWRRPLELWALAEPIVLARGDWNGQLPPDLAGRTHVVPDFSVAISATAVRAALAAGEWPQAWLPAPVLAYIAAHGLYGAQPPRVAASRERS